MISSPGSDAFIFLDPPYFTATKLYGKNGSLHSFDHERLAATLKGSPHRFLMTYDDCDEIRERKRMSILEKKDVFQTNSYQLPHVLAFKNSTGKFTVSLRVTIILSHRKA